MSGEPTVTVIIPTYREEHHIEACLDAVARQTWAHIVEVFVVDGGSDDRTVEVATRAGARVLDNPSRIQAAAMNIGIEAASGDIIVRVDGHCVIAEDYVERCVEALQATGAAMVGGPMIPVKPRSSIGRAIAAAMASPLGPGTARFHQPDGAAGWVDTVYLGAYRTELVRALGGYATDVGVNEDAELAFRMRSHGGIWFDPSIRSTYVPRDSLVAVGRQFWRYGRSRAMTARRHPQSISPRQLAAPLLVLGLLSPWRRIVAAAYAAVVAAETARLVAGHGVDAARAAVVLPTMHLSWGAGMLVGIAGARPPQAIRSATR